MRDEEQTSLKDDDVCVACQNTDGSSLMKQLQAYLSWSDVSNLGKRANQSLKKWERGPDWQCP